MNGKLDKPQFVRIPKYADEITAEYIEMYNLLAISDDQEDKDLKAYIDDHVNRLIKLRHMGKVSALELVAKLGIFMSIKGVECCNGQIKATNGHGRISSVV